MTTSTDCASTELSSHSRSELREGSVRKPFSNTSTEGMKMDRTDLYWQRRLGELERRIEKLEAELSATKVNPNNRSEFYSIDEFAAALGVHRLTISRRIKNGVISAVKVGKTWRIPKSELEKIFEA